MTPRKPRLPRKADLPHRFTAEPTVTWRVWDELTKDYVDPYMEGRDEDFAEYIANAMEAQR